MTSAGAGAAPGRSSDPARAEAGGCRCASPHLACLGQSQVQPGLLPLFRACHCYGWVAAPGAPRFGMNLLVVHPNQENYVCSSRAEQEVEAYWEPWLLGHGCPQVEQNCTRRDYCKRMLGLGVKCPHGANMGLGSAHLLPPTHTIVLGLPPPPILLISLHAASEPGKAGCWLEEVAAAQRNSP